MVTKFATDLIENRLRFDDQARFALLMPANSAVRRCWITAFGQCDREHLPVYLWSSNPLNTSPRERQPGDCEGQVLQRVGQSDDPARREAD
jgi:hypothetical protein